MRRERVYYINKGNRLETRRPPRGTCFQTARYCQVCLRFSITSFTFEKAPPTEFGLLALESKVTRGQMKTEPVVSSPRH